jgi:hypothetical protein
VGLRTSRLAFGGNVFGIDQRWTLRYTTSDFLEIYFFLVIGPLPPLILHKSTSYLFQLQMSSVSLF